MATVLKKAPLNGNGQNRFMTTWTDHHARELATVFAVPADQIELTEHPLDPHVKLARVSFLRGAGVASAIASFLNREIYKPPAVSGLDDLHYTTNMCAFIDTDAVLPQLCLTLSDAPNDFIERLRDRLSDIRFVALHPQILPAMRASGSYVTAKRSLLELEF